jgi:hypothetical protein
MLLIDLLKIFIKMSDIIKTEKDLNLMLSSMRALLGEITPSLRSVSNELRGKTIIWQGVFDSEATDDDFELLSMASGEVIAEYNDFSLEEIITRIPYPNKMNHLKNLVYLRHESNYYKE